MSRAGPARPAEVVRPHATSPTGGVPAGARDLPMSRSPESGSSRKTELALAAPAADRSRAKGTDASIAIRQLVLGQGPSAGAPWPHVVPSEHLRGRPLAGVPIIGVGASSLAHLCLHRLRPLGEASLERTLNPPVQLSRCRLDSLVGDDATDGDGAPCSGVDAAEPHRPSSGASPIPERDFQRRGCHPHHDLPPGLREAPERGALHEVELITLFAGAPAEIRHVQPHAATRRERHRKQKHAGIGQRRHEPPLQRCDLEAARTTDRHSQSFSPPAGLPASGGIGFPA